MLFLLHAFSTCSSCWLRGQPQRLALAILGQQKRVKGLMDGSCSMFMPLRLAVAHNRAYRAESSPMVMTPGFGPEWLGILQCWRWGPVIEWQVNPTTTAYLYGSSTVWTHRSTHLLQPTSWHFVLQHSVVVASKSLPVGGLKR